MSEYRRAFQPGGSFFLTFVTYERRRLFDAPSARRMLRDAMAAEQAAHSFVIDAIVLLPDHVHMIMALPDGESDFSSRIDRIKRSFTKQYLAARGWEGAISPRRVERNERGIWQRRFWEHEIRDERDWENHINYIHFNPVKHGLVECPHSWEFSSFHRFVARGVYEPTWQCECDGRVVRPIDFSEIAASAME